MSLKDLYCERIIFFVDARGDRDCPEKACAVLLDIEYLVGSCGFSWFSRPVGIFWRGIRLLEFWPRGRSRRQRFGILNVTKVARLGLLHLHLSSQGPGVRIRTIDLRAGVFVGRPLLDLGLRLTLGLGLRLRVGFPHVFSPVRLGRFRLLFLGNLNRDKLRVA